MSRLNTLKAMLKDDPKDEFICFAIAKEYEKLNDWETAIQGYLDIKSHNPNYVGLYYHLAHCYIEIDEQEEAMKVFDEGIQVAKTMSDFHALGELANAKKNLEMELL